MLTLERRQQDDHTIYAADSNEHTVALIAPVVDDDYWTYRVRLSETQAIVGFPKFGTVGIGFAVETDWNTNLPYTSPTERIFKHIRRNKGDASIRDADVREAIRMVQAAVDEDGQS